MAGTEREMNTKPKKANKKLKTNLFIGLAVLTSVVSISVAAALHAPALVSNILSAPHPPVIEIVEASSPSNTIASGVYIDGISMAGLTVDEALKKLNAEVRDTELSNELNLIHNEMVFTYTLADFNAVHDFQAAIDYAYTIGRENEASGSVELVSAFYFDSEVVSDILSVLVNEINRESEDATMSREDGEFVITPETTGFEVNQHRLVEDLVAAVNERKAADVIIEVVETIPDFTEDIFSRSTDLLGTFYTVISGNDAGRNQNLYNASDKINNIIVFPGEVFSTNAAFGEMSYANGYRMAPVIIGGELVPGMGGGVCQVSSNLYIALVHAELNIVERLNHSMKVGYADYGWDATLAGDVIDLKFENDTDYPVLIEAYLADGRAYVHIFGNNDHRSSERRLELFSTITERIAAPAETLIEDASMPYGERRVTSPARNGVVAELWKIVFEGDTELYREIVNVSRYRARGAVVRVGTGEPVAGQEVADVETTASNDEPVTHGNPVSEPETPPAQTEPPSDEASQPTPIVELNPLPPVLPPDLGQFVPEPDEDDKPPVID